MKKVLAVVAIALFAVAISPVSADDKKGCCKKEASCAKKDSTKTACAKDCAKACCKKEAAK